MDRALSFFICAWAALFIAANLIGIASHFYLYGFHASAAVLKEAYCPFNVVNYLYAALALSPAGAAYWWRARVRRGAASWATSRGLPSGSARRNADHLVPCSPIPLTRDR